jgi:hypothetical protein
MQFSFGAEGSRVSVKGEDDLRPLKDHAPKRLQYKANEEKIIRDTLEARKFPLKLAVAVDDHLGFLTDENPQNRINESHERGQTYLQYIQKFVDRYDLEMFLAFDNPEDASKVTTQVLRVAPSRARTGPLDTLIVLRVGHDLVDFKPTIKVADMFTSAHVRGRNRFRDEPEGVDGKAEVDVVQQEVDRYVEKHKKDPPLVPAPAVRRRYFTGDNPAGEEKTNLDEYRAEAAARSKLLRKSRELVVVEGSTVGMPRLRPGRYVRIEGVGRPFDGLYYVTQTTHSWGGDGAKTRFSAQRAGLALPQENAA